jgi:hypothetical protein
MENYLLEYLKTWFAVYYANRFGLQVSVYGDDYPRLMEQQYVIIFT